MGKQIAKETKSNKGKSEKSTTKAQKETKNVPKTEDSPVIKNTRQSKTTKENNKKKNQIPESQTVPSKVEQIEEDEKILNDNEEVQIMEDLSLKYPSLVAEVRQKLESALDSDLVLRGVKCLKKIIMDRHTNSMNILQNESEEFLSLNFVLGKLPFKFSLRPNLINMPNSLRGEKFTSSVCLFVKDPSSAFKELNVHKNLPFKVKVIDVRKLKLKYSRFEDRRKLLKQYEMFLCEGSIYMLLKKLLGKPFYAAKKYPVPIKFDYSNPEEIKSSIIQHVQGGSIFYMTHGPNYSVKIGRVVQTNEEIMANIREGICQTLAHILKFGVSFEDLRTISLKGTNTVELPIFNQLSKEEIEAYLDIQS